MSAGGVVSSRRVWVKGRVGLRLTDGGEFGADVEYHDGGHAEGKDVHEVCGGFEDDGVGQLNAAGVAVCLDARAAGDG